MEAVRVCTGDRVQINGVVNMLNQMDRRVTLCGDQATLAEAQAITRRFILEDRFGYPIECPLCDQVDRWRFQPAGAHTSDAFVCSHLAETASGLVIRRAATIAVDQVGRFLDLDDLISAA